MLAAAPAVSHLLPNLVSAEVWGGATYDVALRFLAEDPWDRLARFREEMPNIPLQMLLRGRNTVGYTPYPQRVTEAFVEEAADTGVDIFGSLMPSMMSTKLFLQLLRYVTRHRQLLRRHCATQVIC